MVDAYDGRMVRAWRTGDAWRMHGGCMVEAGMHDACVVHA
jgi:hypothetical protein